MVDKKAITIVHRCPNARCRKRIRTSARAGDRLRTRCPRCQGPITPAIEPGLATDRSVTDCVVCGGREFFVRKDFPQTLGLSLVALFGLVASVFYYYEHVIATFATLATLVGLDVVILLFVGRVTVCYRCRAEYRGVPYNPHHKGFDLATSEKYD